MSMTAIPLHEERELALTQRLSLPSPVWRVSRLWTRAAFFVLALIATSMLFGLLSLLERPNGVITAAVTIAFAEWLITQKKFLRTGIEEGFYVAGLCAFIFGLPGEGEPEAILLFVLAFLTAGMRVANGLFVAVAAMLLIVYAGAKSEETTVAAIVAASLFVMFALLHQGELTRPYAAFASALLTALLLPLAVELSWFETWEHVPFWQLEIVFAIAIAIAMLALQRRDRALLIGALLTFIDAAAHLSARFTLAWEWKLLAAGIASLAIALAVNRLLRNRTRGLTSDKLSDLEHVSVIEMAGAAVVTPAHVPGRNDDLQTGGGSFGGAGATGDYQ